MPILSSLDRILLMIFKERIGEVWSKAGLLRDAFEECKICLQDVHRRADEIINTSDCAWKGFEVKIDAMPDEFFLPRKNIFSAIFQSIYQLLGVTAKRRLLYGKLNYLFRVWVTSTDNLLDSEDKLILPIRMAGSSRIMRQVVSIMAADRIMKRILDEAVEEKVITPEESLILADKSLRILLPSAAEEASEEGGVNHYQDPEYILSVIHKLKTGLLFYIPFLGPESIEQDMDSNMLARCKEALGKFGLGCQILDDIRDIARDYLEKRNNYILARIYWEGMFGYQKLLEGLQDKIDREDKVFSYFPELVYPAARQAVGLLEQGLLILDERGLGLGEDSARMMAFSMLKVLDVRELEGCLSQEEIVRCRPLPRAAPLTMRPEFMTS